VAWDERGGFKKPSRPTVKRVIQALENVNSIRAEVVYRSFTKITVVNWGNYQEPTREGLQQTLQPALQDLVTTEIEEEEEVQTTSSKRSNYSGICKTLSDDVLGIPLFWKAHQVKTMERQVERLSAEVVIRVVQEQANRISSPRIRDRAAYITKLVEEHDPAISKAADKHEGFVTCKCGKRHRVLMQIAHRKHYWTARGEQLAIRCGCGETTPTGFKMPTSYDTPELKPYSLADEALNAI
jgi:hypothetical protein